MIFADNLTNLMKEKDISNVKLGKILGVSDTAVMKWKRGDAVPAIDKAMKIAEYFDVSLDELLGKPINTERTISLPLVGMISAGAFDILNEDQWSENRSVQARLLAGRPKNNCVTMEVMGDSMAPYLLEGDILVVHRQTYAVNGNIIIAYDPVLNGYTVKRYQQTGDSVTLVPYNAEYEVIKYNNPNEQELNLYGVCVGLERKLV
jgi:repressor LexA